jgi:hypothetical protein
MLRLESAIQQVADRKVLRLLNRAWWKCWFENREEVKDDEPNRTQQHSTDLLEARDAAVQ